MLCSRNRVVNPLFWKTHWVRSIGKGTGKCENDSPSSQKSLILIETPFKKKKDVRIRRLLGKDNLWYDFFENRITTFTVK